MSDERVLALYLGQRVEVKQSLVQSHRELRGRGGVVARQRTLDYSLQRTPRAALRLQNILRRLGGNGFDWASQRTACLHGIGKSLFDRSLNRRLVHSGGGVRVEFFGQCCAGPSGARKKKRTTAT